MQTAMTLKLVIAIFSRLSYDSKSIPNITANRVNAITKRAEQALEAHLPIQTSDTKECRILRKLKRSQSVA